MATSQTPRRSPVATSAQGDAALDRIRPVNRGTLPQAIVKSLTELIVQRVWKPGDMIPSEKELAAQFQVGRSTIREAVKSLVVLGVLEARAGEGSFVREPDPGALHGAFEWGLLLSDTNLGDLIDLRIHIEVECARRAALMCTSELAAAMDDLLTRQRNWGMKSPGFRDLGNQLHLAIAKASGNVLFENMVKTIQQIVRIWDSPIATGNRSRMKAEYDEHARIVKAIKSGDPDDAADAMRGHIESASARLRRLIN